MGKIVTIFNQKGGVGKTTTAVNLGTALTILGKKVLVADIDPQGNTTSGFGVEKFELKKNIYHAILDQGEVNYIIMPTEYGNLDLLPSNVELAGLEIELTSLMQRETRLKQALARIEKEYDYILIDCPPSLGLLTINALAAADSVLIPIQCEYYALEGVGQLINTINLVKQSLNSDLEIEGVLMTMYDGRTNLSIQVVEEVRNYFADKVYENLIPRNVRLAEAPSFGETIFEYDKQSKGSKAYFAFAREFIGSEDE
jgi:chromosome partitioning protein